MQLGIGCDEKLILFAGKFEDKKAPALLLRAFIDFQFPGTHLLFTGDGILEIDLKRQAAPHKNIHFITFQNQQYMPVVYQACNLFCLPSQGPGETWGLAVNEAMACGKAILVSDKVGCAVDLVKPGVNGYIFKAGNTEELYTYLCKLLASKNVLREFGAQSAYLIKDWNFTEIAAAIELKLNQTQIPPNIRNEQQ